MVSYVNITLTMLYKTKGLIVQFMKLLLFLYFLILSLDAKELKEVSLQLQWKHQFQFAGYYIAKEKGFYEDEGLDVEIKEFKYGMSVVEEVTQNKSTYGVGRPTLLIRRSEKKDIVLLASVFQSSPNIFIAKKDSGIEEIKDFKSKRMMITGDAKEDAILMAMIVSNGISLDDMTVQEHTIDINSIINDETDLLSSYISNEPFLFKEKGIPIKIFDPKDYGFDFYNDILFTTQEHIYNDFKEVKSMTLASIRGWEYTFNHIEETVDLILEKYNVQGKSKEALLYEAQQLMQLAYYKTDTLGKIDKEKVQKIHDYYKIMGLSKGELNTEDFVFNFYSSKYYLDPIERDYLKKKKVISMCIDPNRMPYESLDKNTNHVGVTKDYFQLLEGITKIKFEVVTTKSWSESIEFVKQRKCDILPLVAQTPKRTKYMTFTTPYLSLPFVIATKKNTRFINDLNNLKNKKIGIPRDYAFLELHQQKYPEVNFVEVSSLDDGLQKVSNGDIFGYIGALTSIYYALQTKYTNEIQISGKLNEKWELGIGVRDDEPLLHEILQKAVNNISDVQIKNIVDKWTPIMYHDRVDYTLFYRSLGVFTLILFLVLFFYLRLRDMKDKLHDSYIEIEKLAVTDKLTGLFNRHKLDEILEHEVHRASRQESSLGVIILDIDHFKNVNDTYGHNIGDVVLKDLSEILMKNSRVTDIVGRWGGEEFLVIVPLSDEDSLVYFANQLREKIQSHSFEQVGKVTVSLGATVYQNKELITQTISRADEALYLSKENGRNKATYL